MLMIRTMITVIIKMMLLKKAGYDKLVPKVNSIDTSRVFLKLILIQIKKTK